MRKLAVWLIAAILITCMCGGFSLAEEENKVVFTGTVTGSKLHMRQQPDVEAPIVRDFKPGAKVEILENDGTWCYVSGANCTGYMMTKYLTITSNFKHLTWGKTPSELKLLTLYSQPDRASAPIARFFSGLRVDVLEKKDGYYKVRINDLIGFLPVEMVETYDGDYKSSVFSASMGIYASRNIQSGTLRKEYGDELTVSGNTGDAAYRFTYPVTGIGKADARISKWLKDLRDALPEGSRGTVTVDYESFISDERYLGICLFAEYTEEGYSCETMFSLNADRTTGEVVDTDKLIRDRGRVLLILESKAAKMIPSPSEGYSVKPDDTWMDRALITDEGILFNLSAGSCFPVSLGNQSILLSYRELTNCLDLPGNLSESTQIDPSRPMVCFTFDDGPSEVSERIMDAFLENGGHCTFCVQGMRLSNYEATVKRMIAEGNEIACHTYNHKKLTELSSSQIRYQLTETQKELSRIADYQIKWLRCPYGNCNKTVRSICKEYGMCIAYWYIDTEDWSTKNATSTYNTIMKKVKNGAIILCHDLYPQTAAAIERVLPDLVEKGYQLVTLSEMFSYMEGGPVPGTVYLQLKDEENIGLK